MSEYSETGEYSDEDRTAILAVECPHCGAEPGEWVECFEINPEAVPAFVEVAFHPERVEAANNE